MEKSIGYEQVFMTSRLLELNVKILKCLNYFPNKNRGFLYGSKLNLCSTLLMKPHLDKLLKALKT